MAGRKSQLQKAMDIILKYGPARGLYLSTARTVSPSGKPKSTVWCPYSTGPPMTRLTHWSVASPGWGRKELSSLGVLSAATGLSTMPSPNGSGRWS
jgi:hypothetical protein